MARLAVLLKVELQTVWAEVDTETGLAVEHIDPPLTIPAQAWAEFYENWKRDWELLQERVAVVEDVNPTVASINGVKG